MARKMSRHGIQNNLKLLGQNPKRLLLATIILLSVISLYSFVFWEKEYICNKDVMCLPLRDKWCLFARSADVYDRCIFYRAIKKIGTNELVNGYVKEYNDDNKLISKIKFHEGKPVGHVKIYDGSFLHYEAHYSQDHKLDGMARLYSGKQLLFEGNYSQGEKNGYVRWYADERGGGYLMSEEFYVNGKRKNAKKYYPNGKLKEEKEGRIHKLYDESGKLRETRE